MTYMALYRKWRPSTFDEVKGQDTIVRTLHNQILFNRIGHAYLFCGTRGTGKTSIAKLFARAVNCSNPKDGNPCNECPSCRAILSGSSLDVSETDAASNSGVDYIRDLLGDVEYSPTQGPYKVYIIDEVHMLSVAAFNALLKTLEEPPAHTIFILATTDRHKVPITILSRCQKYDFRRISIPTIAGHLAWLMEQEKIDAEPKALNYIARAADGSMRDALSLLEQCISLYTGEELTYDKVLTALGATDTAIFSNILAHLLDQRGSAVIEDVENVIMEGRDIPTFLDDFIWYLRNLLVVKDAEASEDSLEMSADSIRALKKAAGQIDYATLLRYIRILSELSGQIRFSTQKRVTLEVTFLRLCRPEMESDPDSLGSRIALLEKKLEEGFVPASPPAKAPEGPDNAASEVKEANSPEDSLKEFEEHFSEAEKEDLIRIANDWLEITAGASAIMREYLKQFTVSVSDDAKTLLLIPLEDADEFAIDYFKMNHHEKLDELSQLVLEVSGKAVLFECLPAARAAAQNTVALSLLRQAEKVIHFPITVE